MILAIHQPNYIPWLGYFYKIAQSDIFVFLDHVQVPDRSVANRNFILDKNGHKKLITVPLLRSYKHYNKIEPDYSKNWHQKHLNVLKDSYQKCSYFDEVFHSLSETLNKKYKSLAELNIEIISGICKRINLEKKFIKSSELEIPNELKKNDLNIEICKLLKANFYLSGSGAKKYNDEEMFQSNNIKIVYSDFVHPKYKQFSSNEFISSLSILDYLFNVGFDFASEYFNSLNSRRI